MELWTTCHADEERARCRWFRRTKPDQLSWRGSSSIGGTRNVGGGGAGVWRRQRRDPWPMVSGSARPATAAAWNVSGHRARELTTLRRVSWRAAERADAGTTQLTGWPQRLTLYRYQLARLHPPTLPYVVAPARWCYCSRCSQCRCRLLSHRCRLP